MTEVRATIYLELDDGTEVELEISGSYSPEVGPSWTDPGEPEEVSIHDVAIDGIPCSKGTYEILPEGWEDIATEAIKEATQNARDEQLIADYEDRDYSYREY